jgi:hypothetical protein
MAFIGGSGNAKRWSLVGGSRLLGMFLGLYLVPGYFHILFVSWPQVISPTPLYPLHHDVLPHTGLKTMEPAKHGLKPLAK